MIKVVLEMHDAKETRPSKSGEYLACKQRWDESLYFTSLPYSKKNDAFNAYDYNSAEEACRTEIQVEYWCKLPTLPRGDAK